MALLLLVSLIGELPLFVIGLLISRVGREETLSVISNLLTFPVAIASGLWWPMTMLPQWLQVVGKALPTYRLNQLLNNIVANQHASGYDWLIIVSWLAVSVAAVLIQNVTLRRWGQGVTE
jgi:ABC-2 type transport system permease protein